MNLKKLAATIVAILIALSSIGSISLAETDTVFTLEYPADMQALGFVEPINLDYLPENIVCLSTTPVLALYELGATIKGVVKSSVVTWPEDLTAEVLPFSLMSEKFDIEAVVALNPDLVIMGFTSAATHGKTLEDLGIPVYYVFAGHTVPYDSIVMLTKNLVDAFAISDESKAAADDMLSRFVELEDELAQVREIYAGKTVMVLQSGSPEMHYIQTKDGTLASMADMMGFTNVYENADSSMVPLDLEQALSYEPDLVLCVGATDADGHKALMEEAYKLNPEYWNSIKAIENGDVLYMPVAFVSSAGLTVIDNIKALIAAIDAHYNP